MPSKATNTATAPSLPVEFEIDDVNTGGNGSISPVEHFGSVAAGPVGRTATAQTDAQMKAEILSWSRTQGLFAGIALEGATLRQDLDDNAELYGKKLENRGIVTGATSIPKSARGLIAMLNKFSAREKRASKN